ncbi:MAG: choice-of-anchor D domain-containing protein [Myxococcota bacterium]
MRYGWSLVWLALGSLTTGCQEFSLEDKPDDVVGDIPEETDVPVDAPDITVEPMNLDFGYLPVNCVSEPLTVTITNEGTADLEVTGISLVGSESEVYDLSAAPITLAPGESSDISVTFEPTVNDLFDQARIKVDSNDPDEETVRVELLGGAAENATWDELFIQEVQTSVDVLWSIDKSGSMSGEVAALAAEFNTFIQNFDALGLDYQIAVITTDPSEAFFQGPIITSSDPDPVGAFTSVTSLGGGGGESGLDATYAALTEPNLSDPNATYPASGFLRKDANLAVVVVSDEDDQSNMSVANYASWLENLKSDPSMTSLSGITGPANNPGGGPFNLGFACSTYSTGVDADYAPRYGDAITSTGGIHANICTMEFNVFLNYLSYAAAGLKFEFELTYEPSSLAAITVEVDGVEVDYDPFDGWTYDSDTNTVSFHGAAIPGPSSAISITYPFQTVCE